MSSTAATRAGPTGFGLHRELLKAGIDCMVVAPSLVPQQAGDRIKTDPRDALKLARFLRSGDLTPIHVPDEQTEAMRDLERAREDAKRAERTSRHQLSKFLLRHGLRYAGKSWSQRYLDWIREQGSSSWPRARWPVSTAFWITTFSPGLGMVVPRSGQRIDEAGR